MAPNTAIIELPTLKRTRRYGAKVKTGCITCKCTSTGRRCDGYSQQNRSSNPHHSPPAQAPPPPFIPFLTTTGATSGIHYLEFYHHCTRHTLSSSFDSGFWSLTVLQIAASEQSVRHALIALGYLNKHESGSLKHARSHFASADHQHGTLFFHYNKAVRCLVERMQEPSYAPEVGLVTCLLFICIEFLRGNYHTAFTHLDSGLKIVSEWQQGRLDNTAACQPDDSTRTQSSTLRSATMQDTLIPMFIRTLTPALLYGLSIEDIIPVPIPTPQTPFPQSSTFTTLHEAQSAILTLRNAALLFSRTLGRNLFQRVPLTAQDLQTQSQLLACHAAWHAGMCALKRTNQLSKAEELKVSTLYVAYYATYIATATATSMAQSPYDAHLERFKTLNYHAQRVLESMDLPANRSSSSPSSSLSSSSSHNPPSSSPSAHFTFEISLIPCLHYVATRCRHPPTRRTAIVLLALNPPREALWDAEQHALVARRCVEIEEAQVDPQTGWPVEESRLWAAVIDGNMDRNGGFWVTFAKAGWAMGERAKIGGSGRSDAQWQEWLVL